MLRTAQLLPERSLTLGFDSDRFQPRVASLLSGLMTAIRTGLTPASDDEHEQQNHPAKGARVI